MKQRQYNDAINMISHLILTKPLPVIGLLKRYGVVFKGTPGRIQLISAVVELLQKGDPKFQNDLGKLLTIHIQYKGKEMLALAESDFSSYSDEDEDEFFGTLIKGAIGAVGSLLKGRKNRRRGGGGSNTAAMQAAQAKRDMQLQMERMRKEAEERRRREEEQRRREEEERKRREEAQAAKRRQTTMLVAGGGIAVLALIGVFMMKSNSSPQYVAAPQPVAVR